MKGELLDYPETNGAQKEYQEQMVLLEPRGKYSV